MKFIQGWNKASGGCVPECCPFTFSLHRLRNYSHTHVKKSYLVCPSGKILVGEM